MTMRDFSCFRDGAVTLAAAGPGPVTVGAGSAALDRSLQATTASVYRAALSSRKELLVRVTWTRSAAAGGATGLSVAVEDMAPKRLGPTAGFTPRRLIPASSQVQQLLQKKRGSRSFVTEAGTVMAMYWDTADAKYLSSSPEPSGGYYLVVVADAELVLLLGGGGDDAAAVRELSRRFAAAPRRAVLLSRREQLRAPPTAAALAHSTRCRFRDGGAEHEVTVVCRGGEEWGPSSSGDDDVGEVAVSVDGKTVAEARRVKWNFRGNRTAVLADGAVVEVMWDVHDWWFSGAGAGGAAQFMVKARGAADGRGRVWMDEEMAKKGQPPAGFFLHMQCYRR